MSRRLPISAALESHRAALAACRRCTLPPDVRPVVSHAREPRIVLVGQAPGRAEVSNGRAFSGRAGKTLFRWFERAGFTEDVVREHVYIAAVTRCFPGAHPSGRGDRVPNPSERTACAGWLDAELRIIRPELIIPVGRLAMDRFFGPRPLDALVGREHEVAYDGGRAVAVPLPHPSGASSWVHAAEHQALLQRALELLAVRFAALGIGEGVRSAA
ncbi:Uracil-DNA glycosylase superfamily [Gemmatirosa kalamazoonensis]|uniref:Uracil-DNA glycosylase superfamily n=1 Tax=Gemmatirosa kalamazoonensis TaxID=861299 RepID=W0RHN5_9BACT|nr:uracil-DNA glycosylase family protein [Gemmatirosa kalamazoonensis]AHG90276.1 Uracil-DNA glycosylase superfamily [Gemmatirosa kalamazoonensis]